jgi:hypothetical protein
MKALTMVLILFSAIGFVLAVYSAFVGEIYGIPPEGFSRGCSNLALIAIALNLWSEGTKQEERLMNSSS